MADVASFDEIAEEFRARTSRIIWCTMATVDTRGRPRTRIVHPLWDGMTAWMTSRPGSLKTKHIAANPHVSLTYWDPQQELIYVEAVAEWVDDIETRRWVWDFAQSVPPPLGFDPATVSASPEAEDFGVIKLTPWQINVPEFPAPVPRIWRAPH